ncbi:MAG: hypothetical protein KatS3mg102_1719 [Planctomycetota bacterium]|nr:MAG: hypothetical protein KatS3mg102_1719 [Planctomycetota bacterium]
MAGQGFSKRRRLLVDVGLQFRALLFMFLITLVVVAFHTGLSYWSLAGEPPIPSGRAIARVLAIDVAVTTLFTALVIGFMGLAGSHKLAGPLYRITQVLKQVQQGDLSARIRLRKGDLLMDFAGEVNLALAHLREQVAADRMRAQSAALLIAEVRDSVPVPEIRERLQRALEELAHVTARLQLEPAGGARRLEPVAPPPRGALPAAAPGFEPRRGEGAAAAGPFPAPPER